MLGYVCVCARAHLKRFRRGLAAALTLKSAGRKKYV